ncbi:tubulin-tyrosine ligase isoform 1 [Hibiscus syriacus]|uniref:Tubulin-tyrosine ligase isoform 1 n=1 Tax=Hibiscus syriacus TaxID=106335 RepID=A0A6A2XKI1_HIBSY|nr:tubulin-tyrosine ligase isoform 1 [Hibiscus syriacus]
MHKDFQSSYPTPQILVPSTGSPNCIETSSMAGYAILAAAAPWIFRPLGNFVSPLLCSCDVVLLVVTSLFARIIMLVEAVFSAFVMIVYIGITMVVDSDQQMALLQYQREKLHFLSEEVLRLQECISKYEGSNDGTTPQVDLAHLLAARDQELRTLSAETWVWGLTADTLNARKVIRWISISNTYARVNICISFLAKTCLFFNGGDGGRGLARSNNQQSGKLETPNSKMVKTIVISHCHVEIYVAENPETACRRKREVESYSRRVEHLSSKDQWLKASLNEPWRLSGCRTSNYRRFQRLEEIHRHIHQVNEEPKLLLPRHVRTD